MTILSPLSGFSYGPSPRHFWRSWRSSHLLWSQLFPSQIHLIPNPNFLMSTISICGSLFYTMLTSVSLISCYCNTRNLLQTTIRPPLCKCHILRRLVTKQRLAKSAFVYAQHGAVNKTYSIEYAWLHDKRERTKNHLFSEFSCFDSNNKSALIPSDVHASFMLICNRDKRVDNRKWIFH